MRNMASYSLMVLVCCSCVAWADVSSGPMVGADVAALNVEVVTGEFAEKTVDYAAKRNEQPTVFVFVNAERFDRPAGRFLKKLDEAMKAHSGKATVVAVWLTDQKDATTNRLKAIQMSLQFQSTSLAVYSSLKDLPEGWALNTDASVTAVVVAKKKVTANFAYNSINETVVPEVSKAVEMVVK